MVERDGVFPNRKLSNVISPRAVRQPITPQVGRVLHNSDVCLPQQPTRWISNRAGQTAAIHLRDAWNCTRERNDKHRRRQERGEPLHVGLSYWGRLRFYSWLVIRSRARA